MLERAVRSGSTRPTACIDCEVGVPTQVLALRVWGAKALAKMGMRDEAIQYAQDSKGLNEPLMAIAEFCEGVLLDAGFVDEAYARYAVEATYSTTNLATFKAVAKKYPGIPKETILRDLVASQPGQEGKWFAAAKDSDLFELAIELVN